MPSSFFTVFILSSFFLLSGQTVTYGAEVSSETALSEVSAVTALSEEARGVELPALNSPKEKYEAEMTAIDCLLESNAIRQLERMNRLDDEKSNGDYSLSISNEIMALWQAEMNLYCKQIEVMSKYVETLEKEQQSNFSQSRQKEIIKLRLQIDNLFRFIDLNLELGPPPHRFVV